MSKIVKVIEAFVGETVRIRWRRVNPDPTVHERPSQWYETYEEDRQAPPAETWNARTKPKTEEP